MTIPSSCRHSPAVAREMSELGLRRGLPVLRIVLSLVAAAGAASTVATLSTL